MFKRCCVHGSFYSVQRCLIFLLIWSYFQVIAMAIVVMLVHTYYGYHATGGPAGVGEATGRAVRTSLIVLAVVTLFVALAIYGQSGAFNLSG